MIHEPDVVDLAQEALADHVVVGGLIVRVVEAVVANLEQLPVLAGGRRHLTASLHVVGHHFFDQHVLARFQATHGHLGVAPQRRGDEDGLEVLLRQHLPPILVFPRGSPAHLHEAVGGLVQALGVDVAHGLQVDEVLVALSEEDLALRAGSDEAGLDRPAPDGAAQGGGGPEGQEGRRPRHRLDEVAAADRDFFGSEHHDRLPYAPIIALTSGWSSSPEIGPLFDFDPANALRSRNPLLPA